MTTRAYLANWFLHDRTGKLVAVFLAFVAAQAVFAAVYLSLYKRRREHFAFNGDILARQAQATRDAIARSLLQSRAAYAALEEALHELAKGVTPDVEDRRGARLELPSGSVCEMIFMYGPPAGAHGGSVLEIRSAEGNPIVRLDPTEPSFRGYLDSAAWLASAPQWQRVLPRLAAQLREKITREEARLTSLTTADPDVWRYWDFVYFSAITQTTVGFGDMLPNSTAVRMIVVFQVLFGYSLLVVVLNIVLGT